MEYGKLAELTKVSLGYATLDEASIALGKLLFTGSTDEQIERLADLLVKNLKEKN